MPSFGGAALYCGIMRCLLLLGHVDRKTQVLDSYRVEWLKKTTIRLNIAIKAMIWGVCRPKASLSVFSPLGQAALEGRRIGAGDKNVKLSGLDRFARRVCNAEVGSCTGFLDS